MIRRPSEVTQGWLRSAANGLIDLRRLQTALQITVQTSYNQLRGWKGYPCHMREVTCTTSKTRIHKFVTRCMYGRNQLALLHLFTISNGQAPGSTPSPDQRPVVWEWAWGEGMRGGRRSRSVTANRWLTITLATRREDGCRHTDVVAVGDSHDHGLSSIAEGGTRNPAPVKYWRWISGPADDLRKDSGGYSKIVLDGFPKNMTNIYLREHRGVVGKFAIQPALGVFQPNFQWYKWS